MDDQTILVDSHAVLSIRHPMAVGLANRLRFANPVYENAARVGRTPPPGTPEEIVLWEKVGATYRFPRAVAHKLRDRFPVVDMTSDGEAVTIPSRITLRNEQVSFVDGIVSTLNTPNQFGTTGEAAPGFGKTICSLEVASRIGRKTLILVHKELLMTQWVERILGTEVGRKWLGVKAKPSEVLPGSLDISPDDIGIVQQDRADWEGKKIVVAMAQSLAVRDYPPAFYESFGLIIIDEVHRFAAPTFQAVIGLFNARRRLGVTGTPDRKDGLQDVFFAHIGGIGVVGKVEQATPRIHQVKTPVVPSPDDEKRMKRFGRWDNVKIIDFITTHARRNADIVKYLIQAAKAGRKILLLSERRDHLDLLKDAFVAACQAEALPFSTDYYVGGMDLAARSRAEQMQVLFATWQMAEEGLDIASLDTLVMATPRRGIRQAVGRILRLKDGKKTPVVVDLIDARIPSLKRRFDARKKEYTSLNWLNHDSSRTAA